ncbi:sugar transferase [Thalassotalea insulae]|uniref:Sugar transferase n=1 Tax=Thalassotalea insulae TaxID=2056778 RepID=A0ABQ6GS61_9GAMM|nr:sugar transferase [Thalassotalea insulae]GLX78788.1 sugar transferase [Thalassotalea insulae]
MVKRLCDLILTLTALILLAIPLALLALVIRIKLGSPVLFVQQRPGRDGKLFKLFKFRSMTDAKDTDGKLLPDSERLTSFGKKLRATSLDELPSLWCVIKGDMSLVGPRPLLEEYLPLYSKEQARRHDVRPGITGWAQVNGRNAISWQEKFELDTWYVDNQSLWLDINILFLTIKKVFQKADINADGEVTMAKFTGNNDE